MPIHDWTRVDAGLFHDFHQGWICALSDALDLGGLPPNYYALIAPRIQEPVPDITISRLTLGEAEIYAHKADCIIIRHRYKDVVAAIEIVSPGNKISLIELRSFVEKIADRIRQNVHLLVVDPFPPGAYDPQGIHKAIWDEVEINNFELPKCQPLTLAAYEAGPQVNAYIEPIAVGDSLSEMPLFLQPELYVPVPLEATYQATWKAFPAVLKRLLEGPDGTPL